MRLRTGLFWVFLLAASLPPLVAQPNVLTFHNDVARTGQNLAETILTPSNVNSAAFGKLFQATLDGLVDAQPLYVFGLSIPNQGTHNVLIVATENDSLYALDADTGAQLWQAVLLFAGETASDDRNCGSITPEIGISSTPVISLAPNTPANAIFAVAMSKDSAGNYHQRLWEVSLTTGTPLATAVEIAGRYPGTGPNSAGGYLYFEAAKYKERAGLLLLNGVLYLGWASHCDHPSYNGWIMGYNTTTLARTSLLNLTPNGIDGAIWSSGGGFAADPNGYIYFLDANGTFDTTLNAQGFPSLGDFGNSFIKLSATGTQLTVADYFTMYNTTDESDLDWDLGSGGALVLPDMTDASGNVWQLAIGAGKDSNIYIVNRNNMGKFNPQNDDAIYQELDGVLTAPVSPRTGLPGGVWSVPAYFNGQVYFGPVNGSILAFQFTNALLAPTPASATREKFTYTGATPSISANGSANGILWAVDADATAVLHAYSAGNLAQELYNTGQAPNGRDHFGAGKKFAVPTIANGKVYVGTPNGVAAFGLLSQ
jgi:hypothetical protein